MEKLMDTCTLEEFVLKTFKGAEKATMDEIQNFADFIREKYNFKEGEKHTIGEWKTLTMELAKSVERIDCRINVVKINEDSKLPAFSRDGDACMDCFADKEVTIPGFTLEKGLGRALVPLGFKLALPKGWEALIRPRSGLALKEGLTILNSPGTIDENYRGELGAIVCNTTTKEYVVKKGERICQLAIRPIYGSGHNIDFTNKSCGVLWNEVAELDETNRGEGGFGSSGKN